jgi:MFS family permease
VPPIVNYSLLAQTTLTNFFFFAGVNCFLLLPVYIQGLGGTEIAIGIVMGLYSAAGIVCQPLIGAWVDAFGRRPFLLVGIGAVLATTLVAAVTRSIVLLGVVRVVQGIGFSAFFVANYTLVLELVPPERRGWALGLYGVSGLMATALAPLVGEWIANTGGFRALFLFGAALEAAALALAWRSPRQPQRLTSLSAGLDTIRESRHEVLRLHMVVAFFFGLGTGALFTFMPTFGESLGVSTPGLFYTGYAGAAMLVRVAAGGLIDTRGRRAVIVPCMLVQALTTALLALLGLGIGRGGDLPVLPFLFLAGVLAGGAHGFLYPGLAALVTDVTPARRRGAVVGVFSAAVLSGNAVGAFAFGYIAHWLGYPQMWVVLTLVLALGYAMSAKLEEAPQHAKRRETSS